MTLIKTIFLGTILALSTEIFAVPVLQEPADKERLSNPDAEKTPVLIDSSMAEKVATLYYPWNAIKVVPKKGIPKIAFTASPKGVMVTATVSLNIHTQPIRESVDDFKKRHPDVQSVHLMQIHPQKGQYFFALRLADGERQYFANSRVANDIPSNQVIVSITLVGTQGNDFIEALMTGAVMEIHYQYQFRALINAQDTHTVPVKVHSKIELNGYCDAFPRTFNHQLKGRRFEQGCLPGMEVTPLPEQLTHQEICEKVPELCTPAPTVAIHEKQSSDEFKEYCLMFPDDLKCQKPERAKQEGRLEAQVNGGEEETNILSKNTSKVNEPMKQPKAEIPGMIRMNPSGEVVSFEVALVRYFKKDGAMGMQYICQTEDFFEERLVLKLSHKCEMWRKVKNQFASCFFDPDCHTFNISISEEDVKRKIDEKFMDEFFSKEIDRTNEEFFEKVEKVETFRDEEFFH